MKVYDISTESFSTQIHSVVAESMGKAEEIYLKEYPNNIITKIKLHSEYVLVQELEFVQDKNYVSKHTVVDQEVKL